MAGVAEGGRAWIFSPGFDGGLLLAPAFASGLAALWMPPGWELGLWGTVIWVVAVDVAHTWSTLYRTYLDPEARRAYGAALWGIPLASFVGACITQSLFEGSFWRFMAYIAVYHFARQQAGVAALYRLAERAPVGPWERRVEAWLLQGVCLWAVLWWHLHLPQPFAWFQQGDFVAIPPAWGAWLLPAASLALGGLAAAHLGFRVRSRRWAWGRDLWLLSTAFTWWAAIVAGSVLPGRADAAFTVANVVPHGVAYMALVFGVKRRMAGEPAGPGARGWGAWGLALAVFLALPLLAAGVEEGLWEALVWQQPSEAVALVAAPLLATFQLTHYFLDGVIWKLRAGGSPYVLRLREALS